MTENEIRTINGKEIVLYREIETDLYRFSKDAVDMLLEALEEREQYKAIGTIEEFKDLKEKNEQKMMDGYYCPICDVNAVVAELEEYKYSHLVEHDSKDCLHCQENEDDLCKYRDCTICAWDKAIEMVRKGGVE